MSIFSILVPLWLNIISLVFSYLSKALFSGFLQFKGNFVDGRNNSKYRDVAPLNSVRTKIVLKVYSAFKKMNLDMKVTIFNKIQQVKGF